VATITTSDWGDDEVGVMNQGGCRRRGRAEALSARPTKDEVARPLTARPEKDGGSGADALKRSRLEIATSLTQVALDIIRVLKEGHDLYRKVKLGT
jgi:hypothetical protein